MTYVIIGNGIASIGCIEGIRRHDAKGKIVVIGAEDAPAYGRPLISYMLAGKVDSAKMSLRPDEYYEKNGVELLLGTTVTGLDTKKKQVATDKGKTVKYDALLIATGGKPFNPPIPGADGPGVYNFINLEQAKTLLDASKSMKRAVVIGGGLIGLKAAESLFDRGVDVSIVELAPRVLSAAFDDDAGRLASKRLQDVGLKVNCGVTVKEILRTPDGKIKGTLLTNNTFLEADVVVVAIGVVPNSDLAKAAGLKTDRGILVDAKLETSAKAVYAAGDVAQAKDMLTQDNRVVPIWPNAYNQGFYAGRNMAGADLEYPGGLAMNSISFYGLPTMSVGEVNPPANDPEVSVSANLDEAKGFYRKLVFRKDRLVGYVLVGDIDQGGMYTAFIKFRFPVTPEVREKLVAGEPSAHLWPEEFFNNAWNPAAAQ